MGAKSEHPYGAAAVRAGIAQFLTGKAVQLAAGFAAMILLVRALEVAEYATYVTAMAAASVLGTVSLLGLDRVATRYLPEARLKAPARVLRGLLSRLAWTRLGAVSLAAVVVLLAWSWLAPTFGLPLAADIEYPTLAYAVLHAMLLYQTAVMQSLMLQRDLRNGTALVALLRLAMLAAWIMLDARLTVMEALWITLVSEAAGWAWMGWTARRHVAGLALESRPQGWAVAGRELRQFAWHNYWAGQVAFPTQTKVLQLVAAATLPPGAVAAFGFISALIDQVRGMLPLYLLRTVIEPVMIGKYAERRDTAQLGVMASAVLKLNVLMVVPLAIWFAFAGSDLVRLLAAGKFGSEAWIMGPMVLGLVLAVQRTLLVIVANATDRSALFLRSSLIASVLVVTIVWTQLSSLGLLGIAVSEAVFSLFFVLAFFVFTLNDRTRYTARWMFWLQIAAFGTLSVASVLALKVVPLGLSALTGVMLTGLLAGGVFVASNMLRKPLDADERQMIQRIAGRVPVPF